MHGTRPSTGHTQETKPPAAAMGRNNTLLGAPHPSTYPHTTPRHPSTTAHMHPDLLDHCPNWTLTEGTCTNNNKGHNVDVGVTGESATENGGCASGITGNGPKEGAAAQLAAPPRGSTAGPQDQLQLAPVKHHCAAPPPSPLGHQGPLNQQSGGNCTEKHEWAPAPQAAEQAPLGEQAHPPAEVIHTFPAFMKNMEYPAPPTEDGGREISQTPVGVEPDVTELEDTQRYVDSTHISTASMNAHQHQNANFDCYGNWPFPSMEVGHQTALIYDRVRAVGIPNYKGAMIPLPTPLVPDAWQAEATGHPDDDWITKGVRYGFPIQYTGGPSYNKQVDYNHPSADAYAAHVVQYLSKETDSQAMAGPFHAPPFTPWYRASPMMTRPKAEAGKRRIIVDLSYGDGGVNAAIQPHTYGGRVALHTLPTITDLLGEVREVGIAHTCLAVIDISRAYRHFPTCPLDWPLLVISFAGRYYFDRSTPFGSRMSSYIMQSAASFILRALAVRGIRALMYLDDLVIISPKAKAEDQYMEAQHLLTKLGLEIAAHKLQPPARCVVWLGIRVDLDDNSISIPQPKLQEIQESLAQISRQQYLTRKALQRAIGQINHLSKVVTPARLFMGRLLAALRGGGGSPKIRVGKGMKADFAWFRRFLKDYNGRAIIPEERTKREIWADACLQGGGATDGDRCYSYTFPKQMRDQHHITHLEAINCLGAARALTLPTDTGNTVIINCDNQPAVDAYRGGRAEDPVLNACARAIWFLGAQNQVNYKFNHVPGELMNIPDALSRVMLDDKYRSLADHYISQLSLTTVHVGRDEFTFSAFYL